MRHFWLTVLVLTGFEPFWALCNLSVERILLAHHITWGKPSTTLHPSSQGLLWSLRWSRVLWRPSLSTCLLSCLRGAVLGGRIQFTGRSFTTSFRTHLNAHRFMIWHGLAGLTGCFESGCRLKDWINFWILIWECLWQFQLHVLGPDHL